MKATTRRIFDQKFSTRVIVVLITIFLSIACTSNDPAPTPLSDYDKKLLGFRFSKNLNPISVNSEAQIIANNAWLFLPVGSDITSLTPEFEVSEKTEVKISGKLAQSGEKTFDFSETVELAVVAEDQSEQLYRIFIATDFKSLDAPIHNLMEMYNVPGLQLAITKDEKMVYSKSFGYSDEGNKIPVSENSIFRIASISKPITALAILKLMENGKLKLNDKVFGKGAILGEKYGTIPYTEAKKSIAVSHLLDHKSGWTNDPFDPMFSDNNTTQTDLINDMLDNRPLQHTPGSIFYYSNFGYCVLGRIIEEISGKSYEDYVNEEILNPLDITNMKIGGNTLDNRLNDEVKYYDQEGYSPYAMNVSRMDANGGWLASSKDLVRLLAHVDRNSRRPDILNAGSLNNLYFGFENWLFFGSLPGTSSAISRVDDSFGYVVLVNTRTIPIGNILDQMNQVMVSEINSRSSWPNYDLFGVK